MKPWAKLKNWLLLDLGRIFGGDLDEMKKVKEASGRKGVFIFMAIDAAKYPLPILVGLLALSAVPGIGDTVKGALGTYGTIVAGFYTLVGTIVTAGHVVNGWENHLDAKNGILKDDETKAS